VAELIEVLGELKVAELVAPKAPTVGSLNQANLDLQSFNTPLGPRQLLLRRLKRLLLVL